MADYIVNPRRAPRAPARCRAEAQVAGQGWETETEDIGPHGCQLVAPAALPRGATIHVTITNPRVPEPLQLAGRVAWVSAQEPWRVGVAFVEAARPAATRWFEKLVLAFPALGNYRRVPDRLPVDAMVWLGPPPKFVVDFTRDEIEVLRHVASGATVDQLRVRLVAAWPIAQRALFSLLARGHVTVSRGAAAHPESWKRILADYEVTFAVEALPPPRPPPTMPAPRGTQRAEAAMLRQGDVAVPEPTIQPTAPAAPRLAPVPMPAEAPALRQSDTGTWEPVEPPVAAAPPPPAPSGPATAGTGWRGSGRTRTADAQAAFDLGRLELAAGRTSSALAHLRRALQLAPGDAEIAAEVGRAMKGGG